MTGLPADPRDQTNGNFSALLQKIAGLGLNAQIIILGQVPYPDLINLMSMATLVIQPSRFEGWSTIVQDSKALGRSVICSDIPVHREQAPEALGFFPCDEPDVLAELIAGCWKELEPGPNLNRQQQTLAREREFAHQHAAALLELCLEASRT
jgi:glycosyltransferase involved in cell wall biosynthesis